VKMLIFWGLIGGQGQNRTVDTRIFSPLESYPRLSIKPVSVEVFADSLSTHVRATGGQSTALVVKVVVKNQGGNFQWAPFRYASRYKVNPSPGAGYWLHASAQARVFLLISWAGQRQGRCRTRRSSCLRSDSNVNPSLPAGPPDAANSNSPPRA
jgi:hypothetical protein